MKTDRFIIKVENYWVTIFAVTVAVFSSAALAFDLTPDRGQLARYFASGNQPYIVTFNVGKTNWGPVNNCNTTWAISQWRSQDGKKISEVPKPVAQQYDLNEMTNGWFEPNQPGVGPYPERCGKSHLSRGWGDTYQGGGTQLPLPVGYANPTVHVKIDPYGLYQGDENPTNNSVFLTTYLPNSGNAFVPLENIEISPVSKTLSNADSIYFGVYSPVFESGNISIIGTSNSSKWSYTLVDGNERVGFQGRRMLTKLQGGAKSTFIIKNGSKVTAEFLGQVKYGGE